MSEALDPETPAGAQRSLHRVRRAEVGWSGVGSPPEGDKNSRGEEKSCRWALWDGGMEAWLGWGWG